VGAGMLCCYCHGGQGRWRGRRCHSLRFGVNKTHGISAPRPPRCIFSLRGRTPCYARIGSHLSLVFFSARFPWDMLHILAALALRCSLSGLCGSCSLCVHLDIFKQLVPDFRMGILAAGSAGQLRGGGRCVLPPPYLRPFYPYLFYPVAIQPLTFAADYLLLLPLPRLPSIISARHGLPLLHCLTHLTFCGLKR